MKRVLQVVGSLHVGGLETVAMNFIRYANPNEYKFDYLVYGNLIGEYEDEVLNRGGRIIRIPGPKSGYMKFFKDLNNVMREYGPYDIVHSHTYFNSGLVVRIAKKNGVKKCIAHAHSGNRSGNDKLNRKMSYFILRKLLNKYSDSFCACSNAAGKYVFGKNSFKEKGVVLPNTIDLEKFVFSEDNRHDVRMSLGCSDDQEIIGTVGHMLPVKNHLFLIDVFKEYVKTRNAVLVIVGDGSLRDTIEEKISALNLSSKVILTGMRKDVYKIMSCMDVFVLPSLHEGLPLTLVEAMANGLSFVVEKKVIAEEMAQYQNCQIVDGYDIDCWCKAITDAVSKGRYDSFDCIKQLKRYSSDFFKNEMTRLYD